MRADPSVVQVSRRSRLFRDLAVDEADDHTGDTHGEPAEPVRIEGQAGLQERFAGDGYTQRLDAVDAGEDGHQHQAVPVYQRFVVEYGPQDIHHRRGDDDGVQHAEHRHREADDVVQADVGCGEGEDRDAQRESALGNLALAHQAEVIGDGCRQTDAGGQAGQQDDHAQDHLSVGSQVVGGAGDEDAAAVGEVSAFAQVAYALSAGVSQAVVDDCQTYGGHDACQEAGPGDLFAVRDAVELDGAHGHRAEEGCGQKVHGVVTFHEALQERCGGEITLGSGKLHGRSHEHGDKQRAEAQQHHRSQNLAQPGDHFGGIQRHIRGGDKEQCRVDGQVHAVIGAVQQRLDAYLVAYCGGTGDGEQGADGEGGDEHHHLGIGFAHRIHQGIDIVRSFKGNSKHADQR